MSRRNIVHRAAQTLFLVFAACSSTSSTGELDAATSLPPAAACERYLSCLLIAAPQAYAAQLALYGSSSECWKTPQQTMNCGQACEAAFQDIAPQCNCVGTTCMPVDPMPTCSDAFEPNDTIQTAKPAGTRANGAVCPATDKDVFSVALTSGGTLEVNVTYAAGGPLAMSILNSGGTAIVNGTAQTGGVRAVAPNLPSGTYYVQITGADKTDYHLAIQ